MKKKEYMSQEQTELVITTSDGYPVVVGDPVFTNDMIWGIIKNITNHNNKLWATVKCVDRTISEQDGSRLRAKFPARVNPPADVALALAQVKVGLENQRQMNAPDIIEGDAPLVVPDVKPLGKVATRAFKNGKCCGADPDQSLTDNPYSIGGSQAETLDWRRGFERARVDLMKTATTTERYLVHVTLSLDATSREDAERIANTFCNRASSYPIKETSAACVYVREIIAKASNG
jgi:hypothetical protein